MNTITKTMTLIEFIKRIPQQDPQVRFLAMHGMTMLLMYEATNNIKYLNQARLDYHRAKSIQECGFVRPLGVLLAS